MNQRADMLQPWPMEENKSKPQTTLTPPWRNKLQHTQKQVAHNVPFPSRIPSGPLNGKQTIDVFHQQRNHPNMHNDKNIPIKKMNETVDSSTIGDLTRSTTQQPKHTRTKLTPTRPVAGRLQIGKNETVKYAQGNGKRETQRTDKHRLTQSLTIRSR